MKYPDVLIAELKLRGYSERTREVYMRWNDDFLVQVKKPPLEVNQKDVDTYSLHLADQGLGKNTRHLAVAALRFYYKIILKRKFAWKYPKLGEQLPTVLTKEEILSMVDITQNPKHKLLIELLYSSGLRVSEAVKMKVGDIFPGEGIAKVLHGKGDKDRIVLLSNRFLRDFADYNALQGNKEMYLFPSAVRHAPLSIRTAELIVKAAAKKAGITKRVYCHALRASFATHHLEQGTDVISIQKLMGHSKLSTTQGYIHCSLDHLRCIKSLLD